MAELDFDNFFDGVPVEVEPHPGTPEEAVLPNGKVRVRRERFDDKLTFPSEPEVGLENRLARCGIVKHAFFDDFIVEDKLGPSNHKKVQSYPARFSSVYVSDTVDFECLDVLSAHGWLNNKAKISQRVIDIASNFEGGEFIQESKNNFGNSWRLYVAEIAACYTVLPLTRLWYAANILSLYYCHQDDLKAGYLWAEYQIRKNAEENANRGDKVLSAAKRAGQHRKSQNTSLREKRFARMAELVPEIGVDKAAVQCECEGLGNWSAVKRQWNRHAINSKQRSGAS